MLERPISKAGWTRVAFGDVVRLSKARVADPEAAGIERVVGLEHIEPGDLRIRRWGDVADGTTFTTLFKPGQVLFGKRRACPSSDDLEHEGLIWNGGPGSLGFQSMPRSGDAASGASRWFWL